MMKQFKKFSLIAMVVLAGTAFTAKAAPLLNGEFQISAARTSLNATSDVLLFAPDGNQSVFINSATGDFTGFWDAWIFDVTSIAANLTEDTGNMFLDLGDLFTDSNSISDGVNTFTLDEAAALEVKSSGSNVAIDFAFTGTFHIDGFAPTDGAGNLTFQVNNSTVAAVQNALSGGGLTGVTFSGGAFTVDATTNSVPTPASLVAGLGLIAVTGLRRKLRR